MGVIKASAIKSGDRRQLAAQQPDWGRPKPATRAIVKVEVEPSEQDIQSSLGHLKDMERKAAEKIAQERQRFEADLLNEKQSMLKDVDQIKEQSKAQGHDEGVALGQKAYGAKMAELGQAITELLAFRKAVVLQAKHDLLALSIEIAQHLIRTELNLRPEVCLNVVTEDIGRLSDREKVTVRVGKEEAEFLKGNKDRLLRVIDGIKQLTVEEDDSITAGGCVIETNLGYVESRISLKLEAIQAAFATQFTEEETAAIAQYHPTDLPSMGVSKVAKTDQSHPQPVAAVSAPAATKVETPSTELFDDDDLGATDEAKSTTDAAEEDDADDLFDDADLDSLWDDDDLFK